MPKRLLTTAFLLVAAAGCGRGGIPRYQVSGTVTHQGQPVPKGKIAFEADRSSGNLGPATTANIVDGAYSTPSDRGAIGGALSVVIYGYDGSPPNEASAYGRQLFPPYETKITIDGQNATHDFEVPAN